MIVKRPLEIDHKVESTVFKHCWKAELSNESLLLVAAIKWFSAYAVPLELLVYS